MSAACDSALVESVFVAVADLGGGGDGGDASPPTA